MANYPKTNKARRRRKIGSKKRRARHAKRTKR